MLNPTYPRVALAEVRSPYVIDGHWAAESTKSNEGFDTGHEYRLQPVFGNEIWAKLRRAGIEQMLRGDVLEVCAGTGFLTHHLLDRVIPRSYTANDISPNEIAAAQTLMASEHPDAEITWALGDMHNLAFGRLFDLVIGNSFIHHFHDVPRVLRRCAALLKKGGAFVSLHEPTPAALALESGKLAAYPLAVVAPRFLVELARSRYRGPVDGSDVWLFTTSSLKKIARQTGFSRVEMFPTNLVRPLLVKRGSLNLCAAKSRLSFDEEQALGKATRIDEKLSSFLPARFFGSICLICYRD